MVTILIILAGLGLIFGSFVNALVWRVRQNELRAKSSKPKAKKLSVVTGRSQCPDCGHGLAAKDLIPVLSWLSLRGRCRYCHQPISRQYPLVELAMAITFGLSYYFWPANLSGAGEDILFVTWLGASVGLMALLVYDWKWQLLPNKILYPTLLLALAGRLVYLGDFEPHKGHALLTWLLSVTAASGVFWALYVVSSGRWIGYGDVRLGLITGTVLGHPYKSLLMIFLASVIGCLLVLPALVSGQKNWTSKIPFGPFLIIATALTLLFGSSIINWYKSLLNIT
jgi:leader peptidase (prepilin peptidase) / N-methyltransferase